MAYSVDNFSRSKTIVVDDGTIDSSLDIKLLGKNFAGYGEMQNENFLHLLENFAGTTPPPKAINGQIWYDSANKKIKYWDDPLKEWRTTGGVEVSTQTPKGLGIGDFWWNPDTEQLFAYNGTTFVLIGPQGLSGIGTTQMQTKKVTDIDNAEHAIIVAYIDGSAIFTISKDPVFELSTESKLDLLNFNLIKPGITLFSTDDNGITPGTTLNFGQIYWGTASNALLLDGLSVDNFILKDGDGISFDNVVRFSDLGYTVGDGNDLVVKIENGDIPVFQTTSGNITFKTTTDTPIVLNTNKILPGSTNTIDIGSSLLSYKDIYSTRFNGAFVGNGSAITDINATNLASGTVPLERLSGTYDINITGTALSTGTSEKADLLKLGSSYVEATIDSPNSGTPNSIAARDVNGDLNARYFQGTATVALFADLAEKYLADKEYEVGTVVVVGGDQEVTACSAGDRAFGAVSANPAFRMNDGLVGGTYIALKGRVPIKVNGPVKKGDKLIASNNGCAAEAVSMLKSMPIKAGTFPDTFAVALETNTDSGTKLVEAIIL